MFSRVTAILVVRRGGEHLERTLEAIGSQRRAPDALVVVLVRADATTESQIDDAAPSAPVDAVVRIDREVSFGEAVRFAERTLDAPESDGDALWVLAEDSAPEPDALAALVAVLETSRSVAVAGPKLLDWETSEHFTVFGRSMTRYGRSLPVVADELDQGQHDDLSDVLGLEPAAILVRHAVWRQLDGFDPALAFADDGLDFGVRTRLAGHRVVVVPPARVRFAGSGVAGPPRYGTPGVHRRARTRARAAQLHRRLVYAPPATLPLHWLSLLPLALVRSVRLLLLKAPGALPGEFGAAIRTMVGLGAVVRARRVLARARRSKWSALAPLRIPPDEVRRRHALAAEARRDRARRRVHELGFLATGGGWVLLASVVAVAAVFPWLLGSGGIRGGGLAPLSTTLDALWRNAGYGWRDAGPGFVGAADPFAGALAVLGSATFWAPSFALVVIWLIAIPAAAMGAWFTASRLTSRGSLRALAALVYGLAPTLLTSLADGRPGAVLAHMLLGWLAFAVLGAATSWAAAAAAALLFAAVVATAPSLAPALVIGWIVALAVSGRAAVRLALLPLPALALAAPLVAAQLQRATPLSLVADPGVPVPTGVSGALTTMWPGGGAGGWEITFDGAVSSVIDPVLLTALLVVPIAIAAFCSVVTRAFRSGLLALGAALIGYSTAVAASNVAVATLGTEPVTVWSGSSLSLAWLGLALAAVVALDALPRGSAVVATALGACAIALVVPAAVALAAGRVAVGPSAERNLPAFVTAEAVVDPRVTTLRLEPEAGGGIRSSLERGTGSTLDAESTFATTGRELTDREADLAEVAGNLASRSAFEASRAIDEFGVSYVLLVPPGGDAESDARALATSQRARVALDGNAALAVIGETDFGTLWRFVDAQADAPAAQIPAGAGGWLAVAINGLQIAVIAGTVLLSIPTGAGREADRRTPRRRRPPRSRWWSARRSKDPEPGSGAAEESVSGPTGDPAGERPSGGAETPDGDAPEREAPNGDAPEPGAPDGESPQPAAVGAGRPDSDTAGGEREDR